MTQKPSEPISQNLLLCVMLSIWLADLQSQTIINTKELQLNFKMPIKRSSVFIIFFLSPFETFSRGHFRVK